MQADGQRSPLPIFSDSNVHTAPASVNPRSQIATR
jgi:hypothetical protein